MNDTTKSILKFLGLLLRIALAPVVLLSVILMLLLRFVADAAEAVYDRWESLHDDSVEWLHKISNPAVYDRLRELAGDVRRWENSARLSEYNADYWRERCEKLEATPRPADSPASSSAASAPEVKL